MTDTKLSFRELITTIVAEAMYQDILQHMPGGGEDNESMRAIFALLFPDLLAGNVQGVIDILRSAFPGAVPPLPDVRGISGGLTMQKIGTINSGSDLDNILDSLASGSIEDLQVAVVPLDDSGDPTFIGGQGDVIPSYLPDDVRQTLKSLGLVEGEVLKDNMPLDLPSPIKVKDDSIN